MTETKEKILGATAELFGRYGYNGASLKQITQAAGVPVGSVYHFFQGGKTELTAEVLRVSGAEFRALVEAVMDAEEEIEDAVFQVFVQAGAHLEAVGYQDICPIGGVAREVASANETLREAAAEVFEDWIRALQKRFRKAGLTQAGARAAAIGFVAALEGAFVLSRSMKSTEPMRAAGRAACAALKDSL